MLLQLKKMSPEEVLQGLGKQTILLVDEVGKNIDGWIICNYALLLIAI